MNKIRLFYFFINQILRKYEDRPNPSGFLQRFTILASYGFYHGFDCFPDRYLPGLNRLSMYLQA